MNELMTFDFEDHSVRTLTISNEPWFVGRDVAEVLPEIRRKGPNFRKTEGGILTWT